MIESRNNDNIKNIIKLRENARERRKQGTYIVEGPKMVLEAIRLGMAKHVYISASAYDELSEKDNSDKLICSNRYAGYDKQEVVEMLNGVRFDIVSDALFGMLTDTVTPQGMLAPVSMSAYTINDIIRSSYGTKGYDTVRLLILCDLQDPGNLGTIMRTAEAAGFDGILMTKGTVSAYNPKAVRSTMGAVMRIPFAYDDNISDIIDACHNDNVNVYATALCGTDLREFEFDARCAIVIGNESRGIDKAVLDMCDESIQIPMNPAAESLNASVAAGIVMYQSTLTFL